MGISDESKGVRVYWPDKKTVSTEQNVYFDKTQLSVSRLEGEELEFTETKSDNPLISSHNPPALPTNPQIVQPQTAPEIPSENDEDASEPEIPAKRIRKPTAKIREIMEGCAVASNLPSTPKFTAGTQLPSAPDVPGDVMDVDDPSDWMMLMEDVLMSQMSEIEGLEPQSLAAAKKSPDWPAWEKSIQEELDVLKAAGTWKPVDPPDGANIIGSKWVF